VVGCRTLPVDWGVGPCLQWACPPAGCDFRAELPWPLERHAAAEHPEWTATFEDSDQAQRADLWRVITAAGHLTGRWSLDAVWVDRLLVGVRLGLEGRRNVLLFQQGQLFPSRRAPASLFTHLRPPCQGLAVEVAHDLVIGIAVSGEDQVVDGSTSDVLDLDWVGFA
jgi:hypothetical protein